MFATFAAVVCKRDPDGENSKFLQYPDIKDELVSRSMMNPDGSVHDSIRNIVQSAVQWEDATHDLSLVNPVVSVRDE